MPVVTEDDEYIYIDGTPVKKEVPGVPNSGISADFAAKLRSGEAGVSKGGGKRVVRVTHEQDHPSGLGKRYFLNDGTETDDPELAAAVKDGNVGSSKLPQKPGFIDKTKDWMEQAVVPSVQDLQRDVVLGPVGAVNAVKGMAHLGDQGFGRGVESVMRGVGAGIQQVGHAMAPNLVDRPSPYIPPGANLTPQAQQELAELEAREKSGGGGGSGGAFGIPNYVMAAIPPGSQSNETSVRVKTGGNAPASSGGGYAAAINKAQKDQEQAFRDAAAIGAAKAAEQHGFEQQRSQQMEQQAAQQQELLKRAKHIRDDGIAKIQQMSENLASLPTTVDPRRLWNSMGTADKITAAIGVFLGGLGPGPNAALGIVQNAVQQDIDAQREAIANTRDNAKARLDAQNSIYGLMREQLGDDEAAMLSTHLAANQLVEQKLNALSAKYAAPEMKNKADAAIAALRSDTATKKAELGIRLEQLGIERAKLGMAQLELGLKNGAGGTMDRKRFVPGEGYALDEDSAKKARELQKARNTIVPLLQQMLELRSKQGGGEVLNRSAVAEGKALAAQALLAARAAAETGALDRGSVEVLERFVPEDPLAFDFSTAEKLKSTLNTFEQSYRNQLHSYMDPTASLQAPTTFRPD